MDVPPSVHVLCQLYGPAGCTASLACVLPGIRAGWMYRLLWECDSNFFIIMCTGPIMEACCPTIALVSRVRLQHLYACVWRVNFRACAAETVRRAM